MVPPKRVISNKRGSVAEKNLALQAIFYNNDDHSTRKGGQRSESLLKNSHKSARGCTTQANSQVSTPRKILT